MTVSVRGLSWSMSIHFVAIHSSAAKNRKNTEKPYFGDSRSFKVINVNTTKKHVISVCHDNSGVFKEGAQCDAPLPFGPTMKIFYRRLYMKRCVFAIFQQELQNSIMFDGLFSYRYNMRLKSPCEIASDMTRRRRRTLLKTSCKPYRPIIFRGGRV